MSGSENVETYVMITGHARPGVRVRVSAGGRVRIRVGVGLGSRLGLGLGVLVMRGSENVET